ncbi:TonB-dependent receptor, partial [Vibrio anguillarum]|nr:TonB-dependent receptor [Vibrio anguillarum]
HTVVAEFKDHKDDNDVQLARRAKQNYKWISSMNLGKFEFNATYTYTGKRLDLPTASPMSDDYISATNLWDMSVGYWMNDDLIVRSRIDNVFNEQYETAIGYKAPERAYYLNVAYQF